MSCKHVSVPQTLSEQMPHVWQIEFTKRWHAMLSIHARNCWSDSWVKCTSSQACHGSYLVNCHKWWTVVYLDVFKDVLTAHVSVMPEGFLSPLRQDRCWRHEPRHASAKKSSGHLSAHTSPTLQLRPMTNGDQRWPAVTSGDQRWPMIPLCNGLLVSI